MGKRHDSEKNSENETGIMITNGASLKRSRKQKDKGYRS